MKIKNITNIKQNNLINNNKTNNTNNSKPTSLKKLTNDTDSLKCINLT
jgi:hypothetical protein